MTVGEEKVAKSFAEQGWQTKIRKHSEIIAYMPSKSKMFYGPLAQLSSNKQESQGSDNL